MLRSLVLPEVLNGGARVQRFRIFLPFHAEIFVHEIPSFSPYVDLVANDFVPVCTSVLKY